MNSEVLHRRSYFWPGMILALGLHLAFLSWIQPQAARPALQPKPLPDLSFWSQTPGESRALYSPVLFALPTPMGFSAPLLNQSLQTDPPIQEQADVLSMLELGDRFSQAQPQPVFPPSRYELADTLRALPSHPGLDLVVQQAPVEGGLTVLYSGSEAFRKRAPEQIEELPGAGPLSWTAEFNVDLDKDSRVRRVLVEKSPAEGPGNEVLVRWLYRQVFQPGNPVSGRVTLQWTPLPVGEES